MPRKKQKYGLYDNGIRLVALESEMALINAMKLFGFECAARCDFDLAMPEAVTYIAIKLNPIKGCREVHHLVLIKE